MPRVSETERVLSKRGHLVCLNVSDDDANELKEISYDL